MNKTIILLLISYIPFVSSSQVTDSSSSMPHNSQNSWIMKENVRRLKDGALLVRLMTKEISIKELRKINQQEKADKIEQEQRSYNKKIVSAFKNNFTFCPVYFFFSNYSKNVTEKEFDKVVFLNDSLRPDTGIRFHGNNFLTAEFGNLDPDTTGYYDNEYTYTNKNGPDKKYVHDVGAGADFDALIIMSDQFIQLKRPFPFYVRTYKESPFKRKLDIVVQMMNENITNFYLINRN